ncbi:MAG: CDP-alcohol phosphatidyltransferase family protein [Chloroflexi bacterium]|nr:CDP-alcohol phosphatidyltransferase family protein [Chloroflexota bacterium]
MLARWARLPAQRLFAPLVGALGRAGISPNALTVVGFGLNVGVGAVIAGGMLTLGGALVLVAGLFDMLDGALARSLGRTTRFGAFLDSTLDRAAEAAVLFGILLAYAGRAGAVEVPLAFLALTGSLLVSYARARAEGLGLHGEVGWLPRPERIILLAAGLLLGLVAPALAIITALTAVTVVQRILYVRRQTAADEGQRGLPR